ncbi:DNA-3-methyladenine glycosylase 2 [Pseudobutyrivibrio xylanivorans]|uniref:DNA-(apurinic or apyrimidinic site) lyase n=1 Tax=Pseudobutyrivibrio xylanivorans DSM 14809 TaxID=1123012 RepID=A0A1M6CBC6_PSEXY|nr:DNA glycosylase [Pseudobutyrivibrio xylanivorans]SHI58309.1 N-glycosylase/DNA lyase [Pseudobutyrivibrio xylanivorans DSM 14809]
MVFSKKFTPEEFNPEVIMNSGQVFRMKRETKGADGMPDTYSACSGDNDIYFYLNTEKDTWDFVCDENQWDFWQRYFDFDTDYVAFNNEIRKYEDKFLKDALKDSFGMRILRQDLWEVFISYVISQNNNIPKIKKSIQILCDRYSDGIHFPKAETLAYIPETELMDGTALGYRADYIIGISKKVVAGELDIEKISKLPYEEAYSKLLEIKGIGPKVANCIMLYGFHFMESYPIDTWMKKIISEDYKDYSKNDYLDYINCSYDGFQGYVQQLQFYHKRKTK